MCTAAAPPRQLALPVTSTTITPDQLSDDSRMLMDDLNIKEVHQNLFANYCIEHSNFWEFDHIFCQFHHIFYKFMLFIQDLSSLVMQNTFDSQASIFTGQDEIFAFDRTVSRLTEMQERNTGPHPTHHHHNMLSDNIIIIIL